MQSPDSQIGVTLYNLRDRCQTTADLENTLAKVNKIGYRAVQISGIGDIAPEIVKELLDKNDLYCCATHEPLSAFVSEPDSVIKKMQILGCEFTAIGSGGTEYFRSGGAKDLARSLNTAGSALAQAGIRFGFHNHHREFARFDGKVFLEELYEETDPATVCFEIDVHWIQRGGGNPATWIRRCKGRAPVVHFKDFSMVGSDPVFSEVGEGNLEWEEILQACREADVRWYVFEQDTPFGDRDMFESVEITFRNMKAMGIR